MENNNKPPLIHPKVGERGMNDLHYSAYASDLEGIIYSLNEGIDINSVDDTGYTALHWLCDMAASGPSPSPRLEVLEFLLKNGADPDIKTKHGETAISLALSASGVGYELAERLKQEAKKL
ncbi:MAG TPA: ankyrin repeat domain-containing protein [Candidatus Paceibacterota bacterium]|nr:ankyrin repeat domain-containing protein [Candidatus Paceibacterota bacterium]